MVKIKHNWFHAIKNIDVLTILFFLEQDILTIYVKPEECLIDWNGGSIKLTIIFIGCSRPGHEEGLRWHRALLVPAPGLFLHQVHLGERVEEIAWPARVQAYK